MSINTYAKTQKVWLTHEKIMDIKYIDETYIVVYANKNYTKGAEEMYAIPEVDLEFKGLIPPLSAEEYAQLEENIVSARRCRDAIVTWEGLILDGHNRFEICIRHGIEFEVVNMPLESREAAKLWILSNQLCRRNLSDAMRIELAQKKEGVLRDLAKMKLSYAGMKSRPGMKALPEASALPDEIAPDEKPFSKTTKGEDDAINVHEAIAKAAGVGEGTLHRYAEIKANATPEVLEQVMSGEVKIGTAHRMLAKEILKDLKRANKMYKYIINRMPPHNSKELVMPGTPMHGRLAGLSSQIKELLAIINEHTRKKTS